MKADIHPTLYPVVFVDGEHEFITRSTKKSSETREINGVEHYVIPVDISASTHPFFTGKQRIVDTEGRVERFRRRFGSRGGNTPAAAE
ncbi:MAG: type B 50S ribosomal protein L31 [Bradymonadia bacterium]